MSTDRHLTFTVFASDDGGGNLATVIDVTQGEEPATNPWIWDAPVVVFADSKRRQLTFFTRAGQLPFCGHGVLAGIHMMARALNVEQLTLRAGTKHIVAMSKDDEAFFETARPIGCDPIPDIATLHSALGIQTNVSPYLLQGVASIGSRKAFVPMADTDALAAIEPDMMRLREWSQKHGIQGAYVYTMTGERQIAARGFNPLGGVSEDAATAAAAGALVPLLDDAQNERWQVSQGRFVGRPCTINVTCLGNVVRVGGRVLPIG